MRLKKKTLVVLLANAMIFVSGNVSAASIEEVVVTAQKRAQTVQDVPISISAFSSDELEGLKLRDTTEIASQIINMQISNPMGDSLPVISLRGISMDDFSLNQSSPVAIYVDEVYKGNPALQSVQMFDLARLEVLRGPQGTLYGKNSTGGAVNFITKAPSFTDQGYITVGAGDYGRKEAHGAGETTLIDDVLAVRVAGTWTERDGWKENEYPGGVDGNAIDEWGARITFTYQPKDEVEAILRLAKSDSKADNYAYTSYEGVSGAGAGLYELFNNTTIGLPALMNPGQPAAGPENSYFRHDGLGDFEVEENRVLEREVENTSVSLTINWSLNEDVTITSISSYDEGEFFSPEGDGTPLDILANDYFADVEQFAQDLRISSDSEGAFNYIAGLYYSKEEQDAPVNIALFTDVDMNVDGVLDFNDCADPLLHAAGFGAFATPTGQAVDAAIGGYAENGLAGSGCQIRNDYTQTRTSLATYFDGTYEINGAMSLQLGVRYTEDEVELDDFTASYFGSDNVNVSEAILGAPNITQENLPEDSFTDREWSGKLAFNYTSVEDILMYASYSRGYRSGAFNGQAFNAPVEVTPVDPEILDAYEVGFKSDLLGRSLRVNGAAFYYEYSDQQFLDIDAATAAQILTNIDSSTIKGLELEVIVAVSDALMIRSGLGYLDTEVDKGVVKGVDVSGNELVQAPELNFNLAIDYDVLFDAGTVRFHVDTNWVDDQFFDIQNSALIEQEDYWLTNARVSFSDADDRYTVAAWVKNIEDKLYYAKPFDLSDFGMVMSHIGAPRTMGVEATYRF